MPPAPTSWATSRTRCSSSISRDSGPAERVLPVDELKQNSWLAEAVFKAYSEAKQLAYAEMATLEWLNDALPWYGQELEETKASMGDNFYSYGIQPNRKTLEALFRYSYEQGLSKKHLTVEELSPPSTLDLVEKVA